MTQHEHPFHYYRSPAEIREVQFSHRVRGLDEYEVAEYLDLLADQVHATDLEIGRLREERDQVLRENEALRFENERFAAHPPARNPVETPQTASLLLNAQRVADDLVEEAVRRTKEMLAVARAEKNAILRNAQEAAAAMLLEARDSGGQSTYQSTYQAGYASAPETTYQSAPEATYQSAQQSTGRHQGRRLAPAPEPAPVSKRTWQLDGHAAV